MACRMSLTGLSVFMTLCAIIFNVLGTFLKEWWIDASKGRHGLLTVVTCEHYICRLGTVSDSTDGWIMTVRVCAYAEFILLIVALCMILIGRLCHVDVSTTCAMGVLAFACLFSMIHTFTLVGYYPKLTKAVQTSLPLPRGYLLYQTLPLGLTAISGTFCVPAFISLAIRQTKAKAEIGKKSTVV